MSQPSPAWLRFGYAADDAHIRLQIIKCRGRELTRPLITLDRAAVQARLYRQRVASQLLDSTVEFGITSLPHINAVEPNTPQQRSQSLQQTQHTRGERKIGPGQHAAEPFRRSARYTPTYFHQHGAPGRVKAMWLAVHVPHLPLQALSDSIQQSVPALILTGSGDVMS